VPQHFAQMEIDINTPAERIAPLAPSDLMAIFEDLTRLTYENLDRGECP
jgi:hypothetical protein